MLNMLYDRCISLIPGMFSSVDKVWGTPAVWRRGAFAEYCCVGQEEVLTPTKSHAYDV